MKIITALLMAIGVSLGIVLVLFFLVKLGQWLQLLFGDAGILILIGILVFIAFFFMFLNSKH